MPIIIKPGATPGPKLRIGPGPSAEKLFVIAPGTAASDPSLIMNLDASIYSGGSAWIDSSGHGNTATIIGSPYWNPSGWFTISGQEIAAFPDASLPLGNSERTISIWVNFSVTFGNSWAFSYGSAAPGQLIAIGQVGGNFYVAGYSAELITGAPVIPGNWYYYVVTYNPNTLLAKIYINGSLIFSNNPSGVLWYTVPSGIGHVGSYPPWSQGMNGYIGQILVHNRELAQPEIIQHFNSSRKKYGI